MNQKEHIQAIKERQLQEKADFLFAACMQWLVSKDERFLQTIRNLSQELLDQGYESSFEHRKRALRVRQMFNQLSTLVEEPSPERNQLGPRQVDLEGLPDAS